MSQKNTESLLTVLDVAIVLNVTERKVLDLIHREELHAARIDNQYRIARKELQRFLDARNLPVEVRA